ncbi:MAG: QueT transporter family protein [Thermocaproicibacter melissae]|jgi:uncharacterized membrane protein|uniref:QueT transporter family protein n=1 Tax=Thermocaproicibacter melissae TaxID=2966552 RepID=UPI003A0FC721
MDQQSKRTLHIAQGAVIAAAYTVLTWLAALLDLAYGPVQFRFSEALTILPIFTTAAVPGLTIGCLLSNILSGYGIYDLIFGTLATLLATLVTRLVRNVKIRGVPVLAPLPPIVFNAFIVGLEITILNGAKINPDCFTNFNWVLYWTNAGSVGLGELVICYGLGLPLAVLIERNQKLKRIIAE